MTYIQLECHTYVNAPVNVKLHRNPWKYQGILTGVWLLNHTDDSDNILRQFLHHSDIKNL